VTGRERQLAAIGHQMPDRLPVDWIDVENAPAVAAAAGRPGCDVDELLGRDGRVIAACQYCGPVARHPDGKSVSLWGCEDGNDYGTTHYYPLAAAETVGQVDRYTWPDGGAFADFDGLGDRIRQTWHGQYAIRGPYWTSAPIFCTACNLMGMEEALMKMVIQPEVFEAVADHILSFSTTYVRRFLEGCGKALDILYLADDFATQRGMMMAPHTWRKLLKPCYARLFALGKERGLPVWFHSCGDITAILDDLIDIGMDVWETVQLHTLPISPAELKRRYGARLTFFGAVNTQRLPFATPQEVRNMVTEVCETLGSGGGFICGPDHHIKPDVPPANTLALFETARLFRARGCTR
jgi:uroporphyrinogen decarboxylase